MTKFLVTVTKTSIEVAEIEINAETSFDAVKEAMRQADKLTYKADNIASSLDCSTRIITEKE